MKSQDKWLEFFNPEIMRRRFVTAGLFLLTHEMLVRTITERLRYFYSFNWSVEAEWNSSPAYIEKVLSLDPKRKNDALRGSIRWLCENSVIDKTDEATIKEVTDIRNIYGHELVAIIGGSIAPDFEGIFPKLVGLIIKIDLWWIVNFEIATDPDLADKEVDEAGVMPGSKWLLEAMQLIALGKDQEAWCMFNEFNRARTEAK